MDTGHTLDRRQVLRGALVAGGLGLAAGCGGSSGGSSGGSPAPSRTPVGPGAPATATRRPVDWDALAGRLRGELIRPGDGRYDTATALTDPRFDGSRPQAVAYCASEDDVRACLAVARDSSVALALRSGGHSYGGWSTGPGLVLDLSRLSGVAFPAADRATVGAGTRTVDLYARLANAGRLVPAGSCPTVGVGGVTLGGGVGVVSRRYGLTVDQLVAARVVTATGAVLACSATEHPDLFWACRGGGGGSFGVATSFTFRTHPTGPATTFSWGWPWSRADDVLAAWLRFGPAAPDDLWSDCQLLAPPSGGPTIRVNGVWLGSPDGLAAALDPLFAAVGHPVDGSAGTRPYLDAMVLEAGCSGLSTAQCHLPGDLPGRNTAGTLRRVSQVAASDYVTTALPAAGIRALADAVQRRVDQGLGEGGAAFDAYGGAVNRVPADATAFVHRNTLCSIQYTAAVLPGSDGAIAASAVTRQRGWIRGTRSALRPYVSGQAYQNYADPDLTDWQQAYYGSNYRRLVDAKATYDPADLFHFPQSIPPR